MLECQFPVCLELTGIPVRKLNHLIFGGETSSVETLFLFTGAFEGAEEVGGAAVFNRE